MYRNYLLLPLLSLLVVTYAAPDDRRKFVRVITEPKPGEEYVSIHTGKPSSGVQEKSLESEISVNIQDEGQTGIKEVDGPIPTEEKIYAHKKLYPSNEENGQRKSKPEKKYTPVGTDEIVPDSLATKPNNKLKIKREEEAATPSKVQERSRNNKEDDGLYDFVDAPFGGQIVGSASSQASRINIKKAPNGQDYEYEYVYYYYDENDEPTKPGSKNSQSTSISPQSSLQVNSKSNKDIKENNKPKKSGTIQDENQFVQTTSKGRFTTEEPEGHSNFAVNDISEHNSKTKESGRKLEESVPPSQAVSEERLPQNPRFPVRSRGNSKPPQEMSTTVISPTDTPITRIRANNGPHQPGLDLVDSSVFRTHSGNGQHAATSPRHESNRDAVVQTTPADQVATIINNAYNTQLTETVASVTETVSLDRDQDNTDADTKGLSLTTTLTPDEIVTVTQRYTAGSTDKGAVDLYAILQQARSEETANTIISSSEHSTRFEDGETQFPTTLRLIPTTTTATTTTTTTTTTTPAPTTTTTTTAAPVPSRQSPGSGPVRSRYRGNVGGNRNSAASTTTTSTTSEVPPSEEVSEKRKFKPTRERNTQGSVYSKRYQSSTAALDKESSSSTTESEVVTRAQKPSFGRQRTRASKPTSISSTVPIDETVEVSSVSPKPNFAERSNLRRQNSRNKFTTSASTTTTTTTIPAAPHVTEEEEGNVAEHEVSEPTSTTTAKAVGNRLRPNIRPLRPGLRLNFGGKGSSTTASSSPSTTQAPIAESSPVEVEEKELVQETSPTPAPDSLSKLKNRSRFRVPEKQSAALAPKQQTLAPPVIGQNRKHLLSNLLPKKKSIQTEEPPVSEEPKPVLENEQENDQTQEFQNEENIDQQQPISSTTTSTTEAPTSSTNRLSSLLAKRRPLQRRPADLPSKQSNQEE